MFNITMNRIEGLDCIYCGNRATCRDHVIPFSYDSIADRTAADFPHTNIVPACVSCNTTLGNIFITSIAERSAYLYKTLETKNKKILSQPEWTKEDMKHLTGSLRKTITALAFKRNIIKERLSHMENMAKNHTLNPKDYWEIMLEEDGVVVGPEV